ncbi:hypothetical protein [Pedobacter terrae]|uniref:hypothetical protein n=1 Tax=Pedobacter terrae TaxID=405671 RepID=UPI002FF4EC02
MKKNVCILLLGSIGLISFQGCKKDSKTNETINQVSILEKTKLQKMEKFISIMWEVPAEKIKYDKDLETFTFGDIQLSRMQIELLYDRANEYKLKNER